MDFFIAAADGREVVLFLMPSSAKGPTGSVKLTVEQARTLAQALTREAGRAEQTPLSAGDALAEVTGTSPDQLRLIGVL